VNAEVRKELKDLYKAGLQEVAKKVGVSYNSKTSNAVLIKDILVAGKKDNYSAVKAAIASI
jgi:hypothetical protein